MILVMKPTNPQEFKELLEKNTNLSRDKIRRETEDAFAFAGEQGRVLTKLDAIDIASRGIKVDDDVEDKAPRTMDELIQRVREK